MLDRFELGMSEKQIEMTRILHQLFTEQYGLNATEKYGVPFYTLKSWICYINPLKNDAIELAFTRGNELIGQLEVLDFKGRKQVGGFTLNRLDEVQLELIEMVLQEAIILDNDVPYKSKRKKNK